jgi:hypothetical protein
VNRRKLIAILLLAFQAFFLNVVVPGHVRGAVTLSGNRSASLSELGCPFCASSHTHQKSPTPANPSDCEICYIAVGLMLPPPVDFDLVKLGVISLAPVQPPAVVVISSQVRPIPSRAPPTSIV